MKPKWQGHLVGTFLGYRSGIAYQLSDGAKWVQDDPTDEPVYRENPTARLLDDGMGHVYLDVEGTSSIVRVVPDGHRPATRSGAF